MADLNKLKIGQDIPTSIYFDNYIVKGRFNLLDWEVQEGADIDIDSNGKILTIKKFRPNIWILKSRETTTSSTYISSILSGWKLKVTGITQMNTDNLLSVKKHNINGTEQYGGVGLSIMPVTDNKSYAELYPWDLGISSGKLKYPNYGWSTYGYCRDYTGDFFNITSFPANNRSDYQIGIYIMTGKFTEDDIIDVSENPIILYQISDTGINVTNVECWKAYNGNDLIYNKDKTVQNCWYKYNLAENVSIKNSNLQDDFVSINRKQYDFIDDIILPPVVDLYEFMETNNVLWNIKIKNTDFWDIVRQYYNNPTHKINSSIQQMGIINPYGDVKGLFTNSNMNGAIDIYFPENNIYCHLDRFGKGSLIEKVTLHLPDTSFVSSCANMFLEMGKLNEIILNSNKGFSGMDLSGMFCGCYALKTYPRNLIDYRQRQQTITSYNDYNFVPYMFDGTGIETIPSPTDDMTDDINRIIVSPFTAQLFKTSTLKTIQPIIDTKLVIPDEYNTYLMFACPNLISAKIANLNHGNWDLSNLINLDNDSIVYLINNLWDLVSTYTGDKEDFTNTYNKTYTINNLAYNSFRDYSITYNEFSFLPITKAISKIEILSAKNTTTKQIVEFTISGLTTGIDSIYIDNGISETKITSDGDYIINTNNISKLSIRYEKLSGDTSKEISLVLKNYYDNSNSVVPSATLTLAQKYESFITTTTLLNDYISKGWTINYK